MTARRLASGLIAASFLLLAADGDKKDFVAPEGVAAGGVATRAACFESLERATLSMVVQEPFEAAQVLYASAPLCHMLPEMWASLALTDVVLRQPDRAHQTLKILAMRPETARWARILNAALDAAAGMLKEARKSFGELAAEDPSDQRVLLALAVMESLRGSAVGRKAIIDLVKLGYAPLAREWRVLPIEDVAIEIFLEASRRMGIPAHETAAKHARFVARLADRLDIDHTHALREKALELLDVALAGKANSPDNWLAKRDLVARLDGDALAVCKAMEKAVTRKHEVLRCLARSAYERRDVDDMCAQWQQLRRYRPQDTEGRVGEAVCRWWTEGFYPLAPDPDRPDMDAPGSPLSLLRGYAMLESGDPRGAVEWLRVRAKAAPGDLVLLRALSVALRRTNDIENFEALAGFIAQRSDADRQSYIFRALAARKRWAYDASSAAMARGDLAGAEAALTSRPTGAELDLLDQFGLLKLAVAKGEPTAINRHVAALQRSLRESNMPFFGGLTEEWEKGRDQLKQELGKAPAGGVTPDSHGGRAAPAAAPQEAPVRDAVSELLGIQERSIIRKPGGAPPGMSDVPPGMKDMPPAMAAQMAQYKKAMSAGKPQMPAMGGFGALPPGTAKPSGAAGAQGPGAMPAGIEVPKASTPKERKKAEAREKRLEFDMKVDREDGKPRR